MAVSDKMEKYSLFNVPSHLLIARRIGVSGQAFRPVDGVDATVAIPAFRDLSFPSGGHSPEVCKLGLVEDGGLAISLFPFVKRKNPLR